MARLNIRHSATPSTMPPWTPNPINRRVKTTRTQCVLKVADSHSEQIAAPQAVLHMAKKGEPRWTRIGVGPVMNAQDTANQIPVDVDAISQSDLLSNSR